MIKTVVIMVGAHRRARVSLSAIRYQRFGLLERLLPHHSINHTRIHIVLCAVCRTVWRNVCASVSFLAWARGKSQCACHWTTQKWSIPSVIQFSWLCTLQYLMINHAISGKFTRAQFALLTPQVRNFGAFCACLKGASKLLWVKCRGSEYNGHKVATKNCNLPQCSVLC